MIRADDGALCLRIAPSAVRERIERAFDRDGPDVYREIGRREVVLVHDRSFALRIRAPKAAVQYVLCGSIVEGPHGARITLERRLRGGTLGVVVVVSLAVSLSVALFAGMLWLGQGGFTEWLGLLFLPWVLFTLSQGVLGRLAVARTEIDYLKRRLADVFDDVLVPADAGPYR
jgi:hypothetical protein